MPRGERFITAAGFRRLADEYRNLFEDERPRLVETISWAAANGDRSENGDYIYGRKKLREIDRRLGFLSRAMREARVVDPGQAPRRDEVRFGATVTIADEEDRQRVLTLVGDDEADAASGRIGWSAPMARALVGAKTGEERCIAMPGGERWVQVIAIAYPPAGGD